MSLTDPVVLSIGKDGMWTLHQGPETFYDDDRVLRSWETWQEARTWAIANLGKDPLEHLPEPARSNAYAQLNVPPPPKQKRLL